MARPVGNKNGVAREIVALVARATCPLTAPEIAATLGRSRTAVYQYVRQLKREGWLVERHDGRSFLYARGPRRE